MTSNLSRFSSRYGRRKRKADTLHGIGIWFMGFMGGVFTTIMIMQVIDLLKKGFPL